jgi:hypothetical protein
LLGILITFYSNPLAILQVQRQVCNQGEKFESYGKLLRKQIEINPVRMFTLGVIPSTFRNILMTVGFIP